MFNHSSLVRASALFSCKTCDNRGRKGSGVFSSDGVDLECVEEFTYLGDVLNDGGGVGRAVVGRVRAAWMKFRELSRLLCTQSGKETEIVRYIRRRDIFKKYFTAKLP